MVRTIRLEKELNRIQNRLNKTLNESYEAGENMQRRRTTLRLQSKKQMILDIEQHPTKKYKGQPYIETWIIETSKKQEGNNHVRKSR